MTKTQHWTIADLDALPLVEGNRYEIIGGELLVSEVPHYYHQHVCCEIACRLGEWEDRTGRGDANIAPGVIFSDEDTVAPGVIWISNARLASALHADGLLYDAPELMVEVLSEGEECERRDRQLKVELYSCRGVEEYWSIDWRARSLNIHRRTEAGLTLAGTLCEADTLQTPLLPGFSCRIDALFEDIPTTLPQ
jgi:Uma2 family endonuclease